MDVMGDNTADNYNIWGFNLAYLNPEKSLLWGTRGLYKEEPQLTERAIRNTKAKALISMIVITGIIVFLYLLNS